MKTVVLVRHGKSSWEYEVSDKDRPLLERGIRDIHLVSERYSKEAIKLQMAFSSPANRALHTCMIFLRNTGFSLTDLEITDALYDFSGESVKHFVRSLDDSLEEVVLFGHNYAFTSIANDWGDQIIENVPTSGLVELKFETTKWNQIEKGVTSKILIPKQLRR
ncbi:SixA phosphatase family protein [Eudoraea chungangensis]|uniref:SixA phosphatase family protein n=1 Tax=Eudoraea chungangensis TaxID=1481905 RepID=UPI0023EBCFA5|nr:histidine phosphatase family protein [Eudoraea chungangensis]